jgi:putative membrane protein
MHVGKSYRAYEFLAWSRRRLFALLIVSTVPVLLYQLAGFKAVSIPWSIVLLLGTTVALVSGFKNTQTYGRSVEAQQAWSSISASSRIWGMLCCNFLSAEEAAKLVYRHIAWLAALRFALRRPRPWETQEQKANVEWRRRYHVPEQETLLREELAVYASNEENILQSLNPAARALQTQGREIKSLLDKGALTIQAYLEMLKVLRELEDFQARCERIKNVPYPRQYAIVSALFVAIFCILLPFGLVGQFDQLNSQIDGFMKGHMVWLVIPFSATVGWMYTSLDQVGESTANPFEGGTNDVPISHISRNIEIELRETLGEINLPAPLKPTNDILM